MDAASPQELKADERACRKLYEELCARSVAKDADGIRRLLAPDYELVHMTGMHQSGEDYVAAVLDGTLNYYAMDHDSIDVRVERDGMSAHIRGRSRTVAAVFGGGRATWRLQQDLTAARRDGRWLLVRSIASTY